MFRLFVRCFVLASLFVLSACGQKGALYLPNEPVETDPAAIDTNTKPEP